MLAMHDEGNVQALAAVKHLTGVDIRLLPLDEITAIESTEQGFNVWVTRYRWQDLRRGIKVTARAAVLISFIENHPGARYSAGSVRYGKWTMKTDVAWDAEQCNDQMMNAIRCADMDLAQRWMKLTSVLEEMGDFTPFEIPAFGSRPSVTEWAERVRRERMAGRVGSSAFPMDTFSRTTQGYYDEDGETRRMVSHWKRA